MKANVNTLLLTIAVMAVLFMLMPISLAETVYIHGYVKYDNTPINGVTVLLAGNFTGQRSNVTSYNGTNAGYYQFAIENGSGSGYTVTASYNGSNISYNFWVPESDADPDVSKDLNIPLAMPTPTPTPCPTATPTPRPSGELGGMVIRNDSSSFLPVSAHNPTTTLTPKPSRAPTGAPTIEPTPAPVPAAGILSNIYLWLVVALMAILAIAAALLLYLRK
jgi:hypothetical protein